jgi:hypothetical protein
MVSENLLQDVEPCYYLIENKQSCHLTIIIKCWHSLDPLCEVFYCYDDIMMPPGLSHVACIKINTPLSEGTNTNDGKHGSGVCPHLLREYLTQVALLDRFNAILD